MVGFGQALRDHSVLCPIIFTMKHTLFKILSLIFFVSLFSGVVGAFYLIDKNSNQKNTQEVNEYEYSVFGKDLQPVYGSPKKIFIESLGIKVDIVSVGVDSDGYLETPENWKEVGWYRKSSRPAEKGNLILNGHYDDNTGSPAAFWQLKNIKLDDKVTVLDSYGKSYDYRVVDFYYIEVDDPERLKVFESKDSDKSAMTLITCGGVWISGEGTYNKRLVVSAELMP